MPLTLRRAEPFVWEVALRREVLDDTITELRGLTHDQVRDLVKRAGSRQVIGRDSKPYRIRIAVGRPTTSSARVTVTLTGGGWWKRRLTERFDARCADAAFA